MLFISILGELPAFSIFNFKSWGSKSYRGFRLKHSQTFRTLSCSIHLTGLRPRLICRPQSIWKAICVRQWKVPAFPSSHGWRSLHVDLVHCLTLVDGTLTHGDYKNVIAIANALDVYGNLVEIARACFGRLAQLLDSDEAREATNAIHKRIMEHALSALKTYPYDVDMQLVSLYSPVSL